MAELIRKVLCIAGLAAGLLQPGCLAAAVDTADAAGPATVAEQQSAADSADTEPAKPAQNSGMQKLLHLHSDNAAAVDQQEKRNDRKKAERFQKILEDNSFGYYMDTQNAKWIVCPHTSDEHIIDVWIKLVNEDRSGTAAGKDGAYSYPSKYYLEHYYIRPSAQQIQFLYELEVTGRPNNAVKQRSYNAANWEALVPGSLEDDIYHAVVAKMKKLTKPGAKGSPSLRDDIEEYLRISL